MAKINQDTKQMKTNKEGFLAYKMNDEEKLLTMVFTTLFDKDKFYGNNSDELVSLATKLIQNDKADYVSKLAIYARREMHLRSVSHVLCCLLAHEVKGKQYARKTINLVSLRCDDITEILSYYVNTYGNPIPNSLKRGLADAMNFFDEYQFSKYKKQCKKITFKRVLRTVHPHPKNEEQSVIFKKILNNTLRTPYTWETELSLKGLKKEVWEELINSNKVGIMAIVRNLNNILYTRPNNLDKVLNMLQDEAIIEKSKILPFRFFSAYKAVSQNPNCTSKVLNTLEKAIKLSTKNIEKFKGKTLIAIDESGSMNHPISTNIFITYFDIASILGAMANYICEDAIVVSFSRNLKIQNFPMDNGIISNANSIIPQFASTDLSLPLLFLIHRDLFVDRIIYISDNEMSSSFDNSNNIQEEKTSCQKLLDEYKEKINKDVIFHGVDLQGYGTQQFKGPNVNICAGWNERIFDFIHLAEKGVSNLVEYIKNYEVKD